MKAFRSFFPELRRPAVILLLVIVIYSYHAHALSFNASEFQGCSFHLVDCDPDLGLTPSSAAAVDVIEGLLVSSQGGQPWTVSKHDLAHDQNEQVLSRCLQERCAVIILVHLSPCMTTPWHLAPAFNKMLLNPAIRFVPIFADTQKGKSNCSEPKMNLEHATQIEPVILQMDPEVPDSSTLTASLVPSKDHFDPRHLSRFISVRTQYNQIFSNYVVQSCQHLYPIYRAMEPERVGCVPAHILIENIGADLNLSTRYASEIPTDHYNYGGLWLLDKESWCLYSNLDYGLEIEQKLRDKVEKALFYCSRDWGVGEGSETSWYWVLTFQFDGRTWICLAGSVLGLIIAMKGEWVGPIGVLLLRQRYPGLRKRKILIICILAAMVLHHSYERMIHLAVKNRQPYHRWRQYTRLGDLLNRGYKILVDERNGPETMALFHRPDWDRMESSIIEIYGNSLYQSLDTLSQCEAALLIPTDSPIATTMKRTYPWLNCQFALGTRTAAPSVLTFTGLLTRSLATAVERYRESGVLELLYKVTKEGGAWNWDWHDIGIWPFGMRDWEILAVFMVSGCLLGVSALALLAEFLVSIPRIKKWRSGLTFPRPRVRFWVRSALVGCCNSKIVKSCRSRIDYI